MIAFGVTNLGVVLVPYPPNSEESPETATDAALAAADADTTVDGCAQQTSPPLPCSALRFNHFPLHTKKGAALATTTVQTTAVTTTAPRLRAQLTTALDQRLGFSTRRAPPQRQLKLKLS